MEFKKLHFHLLFVIGLFLIPLFSKSFQLFERGRKEGTTTCQHGAYTLGHTHPTMAKNNGTQAGNGKQTPEISPQFRLGSATRPHEVGIGSNRRSAGCGEYVLGSCTHRPSSQQSWRRLNTLSKREISYAL